jgi:hypothetical protein
MQTVDEARERMFAALRAVALPCEMETNSRERCILVEASLSFTRRRSDAKGLSVSSD